MQGREIDGETQSVFGGLRTINAYNHTLKARDIKVRLVGKIIVNKD